MTRTMTTRRRTRKKISLLVLFAIPALLLVGQKKPQTKQTEYAIVAGTIFRDPGYAQPGATVVLAAKSAPDKKLLEQVSDARGEFSFRVPPGPQTYVVTVRLKGFKQTSQDVEIIATEQINATLILVPESKK